MGKCTLKEFLDLGSREFVEARQDKVPKGWLTRSQIQRKTGMGKWFINRRMKRLQAIGKVKVKEFKIKAGNHIRAIPHYWLPDYC